MAWVAVAIQARATGRLQARQSASEDITTLTLAELVERTGRRTLSPIDVTNAYLERIALLNQGLNAFVTVTADRARTDAWRASRVLPQLPHNSPVAGPALLGAAIAHKDLFETAGIRTTAGSRLYESYIPAKDAYVVSQLARAGAVMLGKTNTHELGGGVTTINPFFGTTRNPVDRNRIPGGSSGGSAAAVTARLCVAATGSDTGGSVRIPAAFCGCVGFKPSIGRISTAGLLGSCPTFDHVGFLTRTVEDAALMFSAALGNPKGLPPQVAAPSGNPKGLPPQASAPTGNPQGLPPQVVPSTGGGNPLGLPAMKIGIARPFFFDGLQPDVARAMELAVQRLRALGAEVDELTLPIDGETMAQVFYPIGISEIWKTHADAWRRRPEAFSPEFAEVFKEPPPSAAAVAESRKALAGFREAMDRVFERTQIVMMPTVPITAPLIEGPIDGELILRNTLPFNAAGTPTISVPCGVDSGGLPIGLQLVARRQQDQLLLMAASAFDRAMRQ
jgi:aspartyl-tRNA(Asn)/glutamyl-tRNA(Gln) amidotransferase subunit A